jgi:hypothetical protein
LLPYGPAFAVLFRLDDFDADQPIRHDLRGVDGARHAGASRFENLTDARVEGSTRHG